MRTLITILLFLSSADPTFRISLNRHTYSPGDTVSVVCTVPHDPANRAIEAMLVDFSYSARPLEGEHAPTIHRFEFKDVPCGVEQAACVLTDAASHHQIATASLEVAGCE